MTTGNPQTIENQVFDRVMASVEKSSPISELELKALQRDAVALKSATPGAGYIALAAVAALRWDVDQVLRFGKEGVHAQKKLVNYLNASVSLNFVNRMDLAVDFITEAFEMYGPSTDLVEHGVSTYLALADIETATAMYQSLPASDFSRGFKGINPESIARSLSELSISHQRFAAELKAGFEVLTQHKARYAALGAEIVTNEQHLECIVMNIYFCGTPEDELFFEAELAQRLLHRDDWDPRTFSIRFTPLATHPQNVH